MRALSALTLLLSFWMSFPVIAEIRTETIEYKDGDTVMEGYLAYDSKLAAKRPGILVVHEWMGIGPFTRKKAEELAKLGYTAFAADIYGKNLRPKNTDEAGKAAGMFKKDRALLRRRAKLALDQLTKHKTVDPSRVGAMGFCFGGTTVLELARSGAPLKGTVSFHGGLDTPTPKDAANIKGRVLALHGADDPYVPAKDVEAFENEMRGGKVDWELVKYANAVHSFTNPDAGTDNSKGAAYNEKADKRAWEEMKTFWKDTL